MDPISDSKGLTSKRTDSQELGVFSARIVLFGERENSGQWTVSSRRQTADSKQPIPGSRVGSGVGLVVDHGTIVRQMEK